MKSILQKEFDRFIYESKAYSIDKPKAKSNPLGNFNYKSDIEKQIIHGKEHYYDSLLMNIDLTKIDLKDKNLNINAAYFPIENNGMNTTSVNKKSNYRFEVVSSLGRGAFGATFSALDKSFNPPIQVAIKVQIDPKQNYIGKNEASAINWLSRKINGRKSSGSQKIVNLNFTFYQQGRLCLVLELLENFPIFEYTFPKGYKESKVEWRPIKNCKEKIKRIKRLTKIAFQLITALLHLQSQGVIHSDIKPDNILRSRSKQTSLRLCDFGNAIILNQIDNYKKSFDVQTLPYRAPELLAQIRIEKAIDMWSVGIILCTAITGKLPFYSSDQDSLERINKCLGPFPYSYYHTSTKLKSDLMDDTHMIGSKRPLLTSQERYKNLGQLLGLDCTEPIIQFLDGLLQLDPNKRFTPLKALSHPFLSDLMGIDLRYIISLQTNFSPNSKHQLNSSQSIQLNYSNQQQQQAISRSNNIKSLNGNSIHNLSINNLTMNNNQQYLNNFNGRSMINNNKELFLKEKQTKLHNSNQFIDKAKINLINNNTVNTDKENVKEKKTTNNKEIKISVNNERTELEKQMNQAICNEIKQINNNNIDNSNNIDKDQHINNNNNNNIIKTTSTSNMRVKLKRDIKYQLEGNEDKEYKEMEVKVKREKLSNENGRNNSTINLAKEIKINNNNKIRESSNTLKSLQFYDKKVKENTSNYELKLKENMNYDLKLKEKYDKEYNKKINNEKNNELNNDEDINITSITTTATIISQPIKIPKIITKPSKSRVKNTKEKSVIELLKEEKKQLNSILQPIKTKNSNQLNIQTNKVQYQTVMNHINHTIEEDKDKDKNQNQMKTNKKYFDFDKLNTLFPLDDDEEVDVVEL